ncbi:hypothetical protein CPB84DRAFT_1554123 [Gymnopilus junonius]|uniref:Uncharacterized protein n=1 Tax=Gymnopilus junonius TaxID=109634 RepID=A0A9P5NIS7_GYMJU|nr:hypothetical protein CPB84DRAFT_1554123 [Gymnopilus junonius]
MYLATVTSNIRHDGLLTVLNRPTLRSRVTKSAEEKRFPYLSCITKGSEEGDRPKKKRTAKNGPKNGKKTKNFSPRTKSFVSSSRIPGTLEELKRWSKCVTHHQAEELVGLVQYSDSLKMNYPEKCMSPLLNSLYMKYTLIRNLCLTSGGR